MPTYLITVRVSPDEGAPIACERLVEAKNAAQALNYAVEGTHECEVAKPADLVRLGRAGVEIEAAK